MIAGYNPRADSTRLILLSKALENYIVVSGETMAMYAAKNISGRRAPSPAGMGEVAGVSACSGYRRCSGMSR